MSRIKTLGQSSVWFIGSITLFFRYLGHLITGLCRCMTGARSIAWPTFIKTVYSSGVNLFFPLVLISVLLGFSISLSLFTLLNEIKRGDHALTMTQTIAIGHLVPLLVGFILSIQSSLNLINANIQKLHHKPDDVMYELIIPITFSVFINGFSLFVYTLFSFLVAIYSTFQYLISLDTLDTLLHLTSILSIKDLLYSIFKLLIFCCIISLVNGYYYYEISIREISLRKAVSRVMTRSLFFIVFLYVYFNLFYQF